MNSQPARPPAYLLRFQSLFDGRGMAFECDAEGHVDLHALSDVARRNYLVALSVIGRDFAFPKVEPCGYLQ